ncbi:hypothetical protein A7P95_06325 [Eikenella longinqua]|uniref:Uncharacterized protein n=1 Tax=Eikenella longinqua TaxID=1795827 RepID=A0A1A9RXW1_9NEIS|nr:hypothetical protein [Eikenella longinqua]OAM27729.1 hypothetical protein A7P95_06325 [Eikenella longinqua]
MQQHANKRQQNDDEVGKQDQQRRAQPFDWLLLEQSPDVAQPNERVAGADGLRFAEIAVGIAAGLFFGGGEGGA